MAEQYRYRGEKLFSSALYYYGVVPEDQSTFKMSLEMDRAIDAAALRYAADQCRKRYPYMMVRTRKSPLEIKLDYNPLPITVRKTEAEVTLGTKETNYHMLALTYSGKKIVFSVFHGLTDGTGALVFVRTLMHYYVEKCYGETLSGEGIRLVGDKISPEEYIDPVRAFTVGKDQKSLVPKKEPTPPFRIENDSRITKTSPYRFYVRIPQQELMHCCKANDASPSGLFALLTARAVKSLNPDTEEMIVGAMTRNLRSVLNAPESCASNVDLLDIDFDKKIQDSPFEVQNTAYRGRIMLANEEDTLAVKMNGMKFFMQLVEKVPSVWLKEKLVKKARAGSGKRRTFAISYVGKACFDDAEKHITAFYTDALEGGINMMMEINAVNDYFFISFVQEWKERLYFDAFCQQLEQLGFHYEVMGEGDYSLPQVRI